MTKLLAPKILLILLMSFFSTAAIAHDIEVKNADGVTIYYKWINDKTELEVSYRGDDYSNYNYRDRYSDNLVIPESVTYNGKTFSVTSIGDYAFYGCSGLTSIAIPNRVTSIGESAFAYCSINSIIIPNTVKSILQRAFDHCSIKSIKLPNSLTYLGENAFFTCMGLTSVISEIINPFSIGSNVFSNDMFFGNGNPSVIYDTATLTVPAGSKSKYQATGGWNQFKNIVESDGSESVQTKRTIHVAKAGTLRDIIPIGEKHQIEKLTLTGELNGTDFNYIREMTGDSIHFVTDNDSIHYTTNGKLRKLDISETRIVQGGDPCSFFYSPADFEFLHFPTLDNAINENHFRGFNLEEIILPNSVTSIGYNAFYGCSGLTSITIPNSVTYIHYNAFEGCTGLFSIKVENGNAEYDSRDNCNAIVETATNTLIIGCKNTIIPNSVTSIGYDAFYGCSGLTSITIPNSVTYISNYAFYDCSSLTSIISKIQNPFVIYEYLFYCKNKNIYATTTLTVPKGTKAAYQATEGWNKFANIVEEGATDEVMFTSDGVTYLGSNSSNKTAVVKSVDTKLKTLEIPASVSYNGTSYQVTGIAENAFSGCTLAALIWNADVALPSNAFSSASIGSNFLLYVKSASYAPSSVKNIIVNSTAPAIVLSDDGGQFYCPQSFTARSISYTHNYSMETGGSGMGWETIALPFNVQKVSHSSRGEIVPFASYNGGSNLKPFWLASMVSSGFRSSSSIQANTPYIIAMPNNSSYRNDYILAGDVTFSAENVNVPVTPTFSGFFVPAYFTITKSASVYALNVRNRYVTNTGNYVAGSRFISNLRDVRPFEAYISQGSSTRGVIEIDFSDGTTGMADVIGAFDADRPIDIYTLSGQKVVQAKQSEIDNILNQLPHGVYIVNGKKIVK